MLHRILHSAPCLLAGLFLQVALSPAQALDPSLPPSGNFDLSNWYLGLPVDDGGGTSGDSDSISTIELLGGYTNALYFYTDTDGSMVFWAPVDGATTSGSSYPRSELRELISPPSTLINWNGYGTHILDAQCKVTEVPSTEKVIIGQIHSKTGNARPLVKLQYAGGQIQALVKQSPNADPDTKFYFDNVGLNNTIDYTLHMQDGLVTMTVNGSSQAMNVFLSDPDWANQEFYFKAGSYCQDNSGPSSEGARVAFYSLTASHSSNAPPSGTNGTYQDVVSSQNPNYYFKLDDSLIDSVGNSLALSVNGTSGAFTTNVLGDINSAYSFTSSSDALYITNDLINGGGVGANTGATGSGTISLQFRMLSDTDNTGQRFIFAAPGSESGGDNNALALFIESTSGINPNSLKLRVGGTTFGNNSSSTPANNVPVAYSTELAPNAWYYFSMVYDETGDGVLNAYFGPAGGTLITHTYNLNNDNVVGDKGPLWIGNRETLTSGFRNPGSGVVDEFAIWHHQLSNQQVYDQFEAMTVVEADPPTLSITLEGNEVVLSWPINGTAGYALESTASLTSPFWTSAGSPTVVGDENHVTNPATDGEKYYRLAKP